MEKNILILERKCMNNNIVEFIFNKKEETLDIKYDLKEISIKITKENSNDLNELYDYIIENIDNIEFSQNIEKEKLKNMGVVAQSANAIISALQEEMDEIKKKKTFIN